MKKTILSLLVLCFAVFTVSAQVATETEKTDAKKKAIEQSIMKKERMAKERVAKENQTNPQADNPNAPIITFDKLVHDYGTITQNADGNCEFKFTNEGREPLVLTKVKSSWGCTIPTWPKEPVLPGKSEVIVVRYNTKKVGKINKSILVYSNAKQSTITLKIKGKVVVATATTVPEKNLDDNGSPANK